MKKIMMIAALVIAMLHTHTGYAQGMAVNTTGAVPDPSAMLDVSTTTQGLLAPRMTAAQRDAIHLPATGLMIYQVDGTTGFYYNSGTTTSPLWVPITPATTVPPGTTSGDMLYWNGSAWAVLPAGVTGQLLMFNGSAPAWTLPVPTLTTLAITPYATTALGGGNITFEGVAAVTQRGVTWNTSPSPAIYSASTYNQTSDGTGTGSYTSTMTGLTPGATYNVIAYAINAIGIGYGAQLTFTTPDTTPTVTTNPVTGITATGAICGGNVGDPGGLTVTARGVCWSTSPNPTITTSPFTTDGSGTGAYTSTITGLTFGTYYYVRAYATNSYGTGYGNVETFSAGVGTAYGGGIIGYVLRPGDPGYDPATPHGLIINPTVLSSAPWGCYGTLVGTTGSAIGTGAANTAAIVSACGAGTAAALCRSLTTGGYTDWYLPSSNELIALAPQLSSSYPYLTSTEYDPYNAYFIDGDIAYYYAKNYGYFTVVAVRSF